MYIGLTHLQFWYLINALHSLVMISPYSIGYDTENISSWITVSHHPKDVTVISSNLPSVPDLSDQFIHPTAEQVLQQTNQLYHKPVKCMRLMFAIHWKCKLNKKALKDMLMCQHMLNWRTPKSLITENGLGTCVTSYHIYSSLAASLQIKQKNALKLKTGWKTAHMNIVKRQLNIG